MDKTEQPSRIFHLVYSGLSLPILLNDNPCKTDLERERE